MDLDFHGSLSWSFADHVPPGPLRDWLDHVEPHERSCIGFANGCECPRCSVRAVQVAPQPTTCACERPMPNHDRCFKCGRRLARVAA